MARGCLFARTAMTAGIALACLLASAGVAGAATLTLLGASGPRTITLDVGASGGLAGSYDLLVRNESGTSGAIELAYYPEGDGSRAQAEAVKLAGGKPVPVAAHSLVTLALAASLPPAARPADLDGVLALRLERGSHVVGSPLEVDVLGAAPTLAEIEVVPAKVRIGAVNWGGPFSRPRYASAHVEVRGPGVPALFHERTRVVVRALVQSARAHEITATLTLQRSPRSDFVADGTVAVEGKLRSGTYDATLPLSELNVQGASFAVEVQSGDGFVWALVAVLLGVFVGGGVYLVSRLGRRKKLLQQTLRTSLDRYKELLAGLQQHTSNGQSPLWSTEYLGKEENWYKRRWTALPDIEGVPGVWSQLLWARNEADLDAAQTLLETLLGKLERWLRVAETKSVELLLSVVKLKPAERVDGNWRDSKTAQATAKLLRELTDSEPEDDPATRKLIERIVRQERWHAALARTWNMRNRVANAIDANAHGYTAADGANVQNIGLQQLDERSNGEPSPKLQIELELELEEFNEQLRAVYKGDRAELEEMPEGAPPAVRLGALSAAELRGDDAVSLDVRAVTRPEVEHLLEGAAAGQGADGRQGEQGGASRQRMRGALDASTAWLRVMQATDLLWSVLVVIVTTAVYVPTFFSPTWGTVGDYGSAFAAGFLGKVTINWAVLPAFSSVFVRRKSAEGSAGAQQPEAQQAGGAQQPEAGAGQ